MQVLITGAEGFIGKKLSQKLKESGFEVIGVDISGKSSINCNLNNPDQVQDLFSQYSPEIIIHLAAISSTSHSYKSEIQTMNTNVMGTVILLVTAQNLNPNLEYFAFASSAEVYGGLIPRKFSEEDIPQPLSPYAASKTAAESFILMKGRKDGIKTCCVRFCNTFGRMKDTSYIVEYLFDCCLKNISPVLRTPQSIREFMYIPDHLRVYELVLKKQPTGVLNASSGASSSILELASKIKELTGSKSKI
ncbi:MAG: NAD-dependent epimerase/dehydratase family protein, partial [Promethearchaeota archaeon]